MIHVITHRGLDPSKGKGYFAESSREAFEDQLTRGFGIEFDVRPDMLIAHDDDFSRIARNGCHSVTFPELLALMSEKQTSKALSAIHLKHSSQDKQTLDLILTHLDGFDISKCIVFDIMLETARYLKERNPALKLAPSVSHSYDIVRYKDAVGGTLYSIDDVLAHRELFDWVWLDEWDRADRGGGRKKFYTPETFRRFRDAGIKVALVTPELHATSPGLLGTEAHEDGKDWYALELRLREILALDPDAVCTDYPDAVRRML